MTDPNTPNVGQPPVAEMPKDEALARYDDQELVDFLIYWSKASRGNVDLAKWAHVDNAKAELLRRLAQSRPAPADAGDMVLVSRENADQAKQAIGVAITLIENLTGIPIDDMPDDSFTQHIVKARDAFAHALAQTETP